MNEPVEELSEKDFIQESRQKPTFPYWVWLFLIAVVAALVLGGGSWYTNRLSELFKISPFLQVTNREISLFLWQNPEYMRINAKQKNGYLPAFKYLDKITIDLAQADQFATAPPDLLFRYHTWKRLLSGEFTSTPIPKKEFLSFLSYAQEWQPPFWVDAPAGYKKLVEGLEENPIQDLATLSQEILPVDVRIAFQGWQNYFADGEAINTFLPTQEQLRQFLASHPNYARNYWRNIVQERTPNYLRSLKPSGNNEGLIPGSELTSFLRVAIFNYLKAQDPNWNKKPNK